MDPDADPDPAIFIINLQDANKKLIFFEGPLTSFFKDKNSKRSHKAVGIKVFLTNFAWCQKDPDPEPYPDPHL
jgi:hypothetical protein